jgi:hypothetical protein
MFIIPQPLKHNALFLQEHAMRISAVVFTRALALPWGQSAALQV